MTGAEFKAMPTTVEAKVESHRGRWWVYARQIGTKKWWPTTTHDTRDEAIAALRARPWPTKEVAE